MCNAVFSQTLRIDPVAMVALAQSVKSPLSLGDQLDVDTLLSPCIYLFPHREDIYSQPKRFKPEGFLER
ncbi:cytochrome P450 [Trichocoleus sp. FACHB-90]|uniref:cytochrome P450 n=1 Tax=Cyanophyceae TaxID=3028117 RepID=UPI001684734C|nr:cytochrome P450 [Trichocoleus sp. FACHB-90]